MAGSETLSFSGRLRFVAPATLVFALLNPVVNVSRVITGDMASDRVALNWLTAGAAVVGVIGAAWMTIAVRHPLITVTPQQVVVWPYGGVRKEIVLSEVQALRWQDSFDLRLCCQSGQECSVPIQGLSRNDRALLERVLRERIHSGSLVT